MISSNSGDVRTTYNNPQKLRICNISPLTSLNSVEEQVRFHGNTGPAGLCACPIYYLCNPIIALHVKRFPSLFSAELRTIVEEVTCEAQRESDQLGVLGDAYNESASCLPKLKTLREF
jgi:hypothetical protein